MMELKSEKRVLLFCLGKSLNRTMMELKWCYAANLGASLNP